MKVRGKQPDDKQIPDHERREQEYRLRIFLDIVAEADLLLLKKLMKDEQENAAEQKRAA